MNKKIVFCILAFVLIFSISAIHAEDTNSTALDSVDDDIQSEDDSPFNELEGDDYSVLNQTELASPTTKIYPEESYNVTLKDSNSSEGIVNKTVDFVVNEVKYNAITDNNGVASVNLKLAPGKYSVFASFLGDDALEPCNLTSNVQILPTIKATYLSKYYKGTAQYNATFFDNNGMPLANTNVTIKVNGKTYTKKTNSKGYLKFSINLKPGIYKVVSTNPVTGYALTTTLKVLSTIKAKNLKKVAGDNRDFKATFLNSDGKALANQYVKFKLDGKEYKVKTNSKGQATLSLKSLKVGTYNIICYNDGLSQTYKINVYKIASTKLTAVSYIFFPKDKKLVKVKLSNSLGDDANKGKTIKFKVGGKTYTKKTDSEGMAYLNVSSFKKGVYTVESSYARNQFFKSSQASKPLIILTTSKATLNVKSTTRFGYEAHTLFKLSFSAGGVPLPKKTITFNLAGKTFRKTTDDNGMVSFPVNLKIGKYTVNYKSEKFKINETSGSCKITVFKRSNPKLIWKSGNSFLDTSQSFFILLADSKGKAISGERIKFSIGGHEFSAVTSQNGYVNFKTNLIIGKYKASFSFGGNNNFLSRSASKYIDVKVSKYGNGVNERNAAYWSAYLKSSSHCQVGNSKIKALVNSLTRGLTNDIDKAKAIFDYVRDNIEYSYYYNSHYGALGTLNAKQGNCVDQAHLIIAMYRTAGLQARYVHGTCHFIQSGNIYGHVWAQVRLGNEWVAADPISYRNVLGQINNWNTNSHSVHGKYASLPF